MILIPFFLMHLSDLYNIYSFNNTLLQIAGTIFIVSGVINFLYCSSIFIKHGKGGTPLITEPPKQFIVKGLYRYTRNPIYVGHIVIIFGEFLVFGKLLLLPYSLLIFLLLHLLLTMYEEPQLIKRYGHEYRDYLNKVPRWLMNI